MLLPCFSYHLSPCHVWLLMDGGGGGFRRQRQLPCWFSLASRASAGAQRVEAAWLLLCCFSMVSWALVFFWIPELSLSISLSLSLDPSCVHGALFLPASLPGSGHQNLGRFFFCCLLLCHFSRSQVFNFRCNIKRIRIGYLYVKLPIMNVVIMYCKHVLMKIKNKNPQNFRYNKKLGKKKK